MSRSRWPLLLPLAVSGWLTLLVTQGVEAGPLRITVSVVFLLTCPGAALLALVRPLLDRRDHTGDAMESLALTVALSVSTGIIVSEAFFMSGTFTMRAAVTALAAVTSAAALGALFTGWLARRSPTGRRARKEPADAPGAV
ncbi:hypothetical protein OHA77_30060 [Streptosporangium sp. NBC_01639]|uniref:hypothetical protein n=1 Tax=unclassified Streptosporangium TaxID=2632669 RepID=UPI002DDC3731|nr:hypothetical protein [Streptosporangium sp. NBC_01756]WSC88438.1 hypothetical protein OIE48_09690 [Streptosporangium sp. NBC_01756]WTD52874.1 hypothetical protein OHA77_30060 [Streptosporangium sp. NBC_01639]